MKRKIISYLVSTVIMLLYLYIEMPVFNVQFESIYNIMAIFFIVALIMDWIQDIIALIKSAASQGEHGSIEINVEDDVENAVWNLSKGNINAKIALVVVVAGMVFPFITSTPLFRANEYRELLGNVKVSEFTEDVSPVDVNNIRVVDREVAYKLAEKKLGEIPAIGSVAKLGGLNIQSVNGELYWVAPLEHRSILKWFTNKQGTPGYVMVSATNSQDVRLIKELNGEPINLKYITSAYFNDNVKRHIYLNGHITEGLIDYTFEIDDDGTPYWVVSTYKHLIGYEGSDVTGVITVNAITGEINKYSIENAPQWIDRIQPESIVTEQINYWGEYVSGFWNALLSQKGVLSASPGMSLVYGNDGESYWYTGLTSVGGDQSTVGFVLVNTRTKEVKMYKQAGATEYAAMSSAQGKVQEKGYAATFPAMYNISGTPTYAMSLKDNAGLVKMFAFVSVSDYTIVGIGETKEVALRDYKEKLKSSGNNVEINSGIDKKTVEGKVLRINQEVIDGNSYYNLVIDTLRENIFTSRSSVSKELTLTVPGDNIKIEYEESESKTKVRDMVSFDNVDIP